ncbi:flavodoxin-dependent (E)-4-hydroxy-3-methylbut-2-enyl-diphosphate synthase, partial [Klebsiella pneumoniae]|nr:flavodoxin-dependent (E)-4-hydroxy-3-methylbut-2-enyl-diphosphate synthase [Klebsiella pneumoniae]
MHNQAQTPRRQSNRIYVGNVPIGDGAPTAVQSMTNTRPTDVAPTVNQINALERVGADIVRASLPPIHPAESLK